MSVCKGVQFKHLLSQLNETETEQFIDKLTKEPNNIINQALFQFCMKSSNDEFANTINNLLTKIIRSRKKKPTAITTQNIKLHTIPKQLVGVIASFLSQYDYINFSKSNRFIFIGCNTPNLLQELNLIEIQNYSNINLKLFQSLKTFKFNINKFSELTTPSTTGRTIMNDLKCMELYGNITDNINIINIEKKIDSFMTQDYINTNNIKTLRLHHFGYMHNPYKPDILHKLLSKFSNIEYVKLQNVWTHPSIDTNKLCVLWSKLKGIYAHTYGDNIQRLIDTFGSNLNHLSFIESRSGYNLSNINFKKLEELRLYFPTQKTFDDIFKTAINIRKICIPFAATNLTSDGERLKESVIKLITNCKCLKYIMFVLDCKWFESILNGIEKGLFKTEQIERDMLKIDLHIGIANKTQFDAMKLISNIVNIIHMLQVSKTRDFMFSLKFKDCNEKIMDQNSLQNAFVKLLSSLNGMVAIVHGADCVRISNKNCRINGYNESWKINSVIALK